jgi:hypothetical protein
MLSSLIKFVVLVAVIAGGYDLVSAQPPTGIPDASNRDPRGENTPLGLKEMLAKQRVIQAKKDHEEMLERGEEALKIAQDLEASFEKNKTLSASDRQRLQSLENMVEKIRKELGGEDFDGVDATPVKAEDVPRPSSVEDAFKYLQSTTMKLVDELKKTTRFSISVIAIQTSNNVLKVVRFLRLRK